MSESRVTERTRSAILRAAITTLLAHRTASLGDIAAAAGVARSTLHRYFADRSALEAAVEAYVAQEYTLSLERARPDADTGMDAFVRLVGELLDRDEAFAWWMRPELLDQAQDEAESESDRVALGIIRRGQSDGTIDPGMDADYLIGIIWSSLFTAFHYPASATLTRREVREVCLRGLVKLAAP